MTATKTKELILRKLVRRTKDILGAPKNNRVIKPLWAVHFYKSSDKLGCFR